MGKADYLKLGQWNCRCNKCHLDKPIKEFYLHSNGKPRKQCKACHYIRNKTWATTNKEYVSAKSKEYAQANREKCRAFTNSWRKRNLAYDAFRARTYRARKLQAIPPWANLKKIKEIYEKCPSGFHVDHIIPLKGKTVSGLHVEHNLQYLPALENIRKRNFYGQS